MKLSDVLQQTSGEEIDMLDETDDAVIRFYYVLEKLQGRRPPKHLDVSLAQLTALKHLIEKNRNIYADAALWTPFGERFQKKLDFIGNFMNPAGEVVKIRVSGPENFQMWMEFWGVYKTGMLGFDQASQGSLDGYAEHIKYYDDMAPEAWGGPLPRRQENAP